MALFNLAYADMDDLVSEAYSVLRDRGVSASRMWRFPDGTRIEFRSHHRLNVAVRLAKLYVRQRFDCNSELEKAEDYDWHGKFTLLLDRTVE